MSRQTIQLRIAIDDAWDAGDRIQVYTDFGTGSVDLTKPLLPQAFDVFPGEEPSQGYGVQPYGLGRVGDFKADRPHQGIGSAIYGVTPYGTAPPFVEVEVDVAAGFGNWKFAIQIVDRDGTPQGGALQEISAVVSGTDPSPLCRFTFNNHDAPSDQVTFDITVNTE